MKRRYALVLSSSLAFLSAHAAAESSSSGKAIASQLFDEATKLMASGNFKDACAKFSESNRQDPQLGTLLNLAECHVKDGKTASAWVSFKDAADLAAQKKDAREKRIRLRIAELEPALSKLLLSVNHPPPNFVLSEDGDSVSSAVWGTAVPVDPGKHVITASAPGFQPWTLEVTVPADGRTLQVDVPPLSPEPAAPAAPPPPPPTVNEAREVPLPLPNPPSSRGSTQRILGWSALGAGAIGLGVGLVFELKRSSKLSSRDEICPTGQGCTLDDQAAIDSLTSDARSAGTVATVGFIAGGVFAATGVVLVLTAPSSESKVSGLTFRPLLGPQFRGLSVSASVW